MRELVRKYSIGLASIIMAYSPVLYRPARGLFVVTGDPVPAEHVNSVQKEDRNLPVVLGHGWTSDRSIQLTLVASSATIARGTGRPSALRDVLTGSFTLADTGEVIEIDETGFMNGLGPSLQRRGAESGDIVRLIFQLPERVAELRFLSEEEPKPAIAEEETAYDAILDDE